MGWLGITNEKDVKLIVLNDQVTSIEQLEKSKNRVHVLGVSTKKFVNS